MASKRDLSISIESARSWPLFEGLALPDIAAAGVSLQPWSALPIEHALRAATSRLLEEPVVVRLLAERKFVVFARTPAHREFVNRLGVELAARHRLWGTFGEEEIPAGARSDFPIGSDQAEFCGVLRVAPGSEMHAMELSFNHHALCVALPPSADAEQVAPGFGRTETWQDSLRWGAELIRDGAVVFRPWDWMEDKDAGVEIWALARDLAEFTESN